jgi:hypothetical protein
MDEKVTRYIQKLPQPQRDICNKIRQLILDNAPGIREEIKWGVPSYDGGKIYFVGLKTHVNVGFIICGLKQEDIRLLEGQGNTMRHIKIHSPDKIEEGKLVRFIKLVVGS